MAEELADWTPPGFIPERTYGQLRDRVQAGTHFDIAGSGPAVMLIHGVGLDLAMWDDIAERLARTYTVIRYDMLGHGCSAKVNEPMKLASFVRQLEDFVEYLRLARFALVGFSMGSLVAQCYAAAHPSRLAALALLNSVYERTPAQQGPLLARLRPPRRRGRVRSSTRRSSAGSRRPSANPGLKPSPQFASGWKATTGTASCRPTGSLPRPTTRLRVPPAQSTVPPWWPPVKTISARHRI